VVSGKQSAVDDLNIEGENHLKVITVWEEPVFVAQKMGISQIA
jgi:hypothetical protein